MAITILVDQAVLDHTIHGYCHALTQNPTMNYKLCSASVNFRPSVLSFLSLCSFLFFFPCTPGMWNEIF